MTERLRVNYKRRNLEFILNSDLFYHKYSSKFIDSRYGNFYEEFSWINDNIMDAPGLHNIFINDSPWPENKDLLEEWSYDTRGYLAKQNPQWGRYFNTIDHVLNSGIYYTACALNWLIRQYFIGDDCSGELGEDGVMEYIKQQEADWIAEEQAVWEQAWMGQYEMAKVMTVYGLLISLVAIVVASKIDLIFPVIAI